MNNKPEVQTRYPSLKNLGDQKNYDAIMNCNRCGFCTSHCPTYLATGEEGLSPRGRNQSLRALLEGRLEDPEEAKKMFSTCLLCGICTSVCFAEVPTAELMSAARGKILEKEGPPFFLKLILKILLPRPWLFDPVLSFLHLGKRMKISFILRKIGFLKMISPALASADEMLEDVPIRFLRSRLKKASPDTEVIQFLACGPNYLLPSVGEATSALIKKKGDRSGCAHTVCCGLPGISCGDLGFAREMAKKNIQELENYPQAVILVDDSSCASTIKDYPVFFEGDPEWKKRAEKIVSRTKDLLEWLANKKIAFTAQKEETVTYHDSCKARYGQKIVDLPRALLKSVSRVRLEELSEAEQCCGGGGTYSFTQPEISRAVLVRKADNIQKTRADKVLTSSVSCLLQLKFGIKRNKAKQKAMHIAEFLKDCL